MDQKKKINRHLLRRLWRQQIIVAVLLHSLFAIVRTQSCVPIGWHQLDNTIYRLEIDPKDYLAASSACAVYGGELAVLNTRAKITFMSNLVSRPSSGTIAYWIGLNDTAVEETFRWTDGSILDPGLSQWRAGEPNNLNSSEDCVELLAATDANLHGKWNDIPCGEPNRYICEKRLEFTLPVLRQPPSSSAYGSDYILIRWNAWNDTVDTGDGPVGGYVIYIKTGSDDWDSTGYVPQTTATNYTAEYNVTRLRPETEYKLSITAVRQCAGLEGIRGPELTITTRPISEISTTPSFISTAPTTTTVSESGNGTTIPWALCGVSLAVNVITVFVIIVLCMRRRGPKSDTRSTPNPPRATKMDQPPDYNNPSFYSEVIEVTGRN